VDLPKYARLERERTFLVSNDAWREQVRPYVRRIEDRYLACGRLRVRRIIDADLDKETLKLTKKYGAREPGIEALVTTLLDRSEYDALITLPGRSLTKCRHHHEHDGLLFGVDVFEGELAGLVLASVEAETDEELRAVVPPAYVGREVTAEKFFTGGVLCTTSARELQDALAHRG
jgi:adenylate cyclase